MNLNDLAEEISALEGGKKNLTIAQIKEVIACLGKVAYESLDAEDSANLWARIVRAGARKK